jgi:hypothetical protein
MDPTTPEASDPHPVECDPQHHFGSVAQLVQLIETARHFQANEVSRQLSRLVQLVQLVQLLVVLVGHRVDCGSFESATAKPVGGLGGLGSLGGRVTKCYILLQKMGVYVAFLQGFPAFLAPTPCAHPIRGRPQGKPVLPRATAQEELGTRIGLVSGGHSRPPEPPPGRGRAFHTTASRCGTSWRWNSRGCWGSRSN